MHVAQAPFSFRLSGRVSDVSCAAGQKATIATTSGKKVVDKAIIKLTEACTFAAKVKVNRRGALRAVATTARLTSRPLILCAG